MDGLEQTLRGRTPAVPKRRALLLVDLQGDFVSTDGRHAQQLPVGFDANVLELLHCSSGSDVALIWIQSVFEEPRKYDGVARAGGDLVMLSSRAPTPQASSRSSKSSSPNGHSSPSPSLEDADMLDEDSPDLESILRQRMAATRALKQGRSAIPSPTTRSRQSLPPPDSSHTRSMSSTPSTPSTDDLFLSQTPASSTYSLSFPPALIGKARALFDAHTSRVELSKTHYSAFHTDLLSILRSSLITELFLCGPTLATSLFATATAAAAHGFSVSLIDGCVGTQNYDAVISVLSDTYGVGVTPMCEVRKAFAPTTPTARPTSRTPDPIRTKIPIRSNSTLTRSRRSSRDSTTSASSPATERALHRFASAKSPTPALVETPEREQTSYFTPSPALPHRSCQKTPDMEPLNLPLRSKSAMINGDDANGEHSISPPLVETAPSAMLAADPEPQQAQITSLTALVTPDVEFTIDPLANGHVAQATEPVPSSPIASPPTSPRKPMKKFGAIHEVLGPDNRIAEGDSFISEHALDAMAVDSQLFEALKNEVLWQKMFHAAGEVPRLVCAQGIFAIDGSIPIYRHPSDTSLPLLHFSPIVNAVRASVEAVVGHPLNHCLVQLYRSGTDYISEHSDKTLDIVRGSSIVNVSFGAKRVMRLRTKKSAHSPDSDGKITRLTQLVPMPHASVFVLGPHSNMRWLHGINTDKRAKNERTPEELAYDGERISLTFRHIGTFLDSTGTRIYGQGAYSKDPGCAMPVVNADDTATQALINAFGFENQSAQFDWDAIYGAGSNVLHFRALAEPAHERLLFLSGDHVADTRVRIALEELHLPFALAGVSASDAGRGYRHAICLRDADAQRTQVTGASAILLHLAMRYGGAVGTPGEVVSLIASPEILGAEATIAASKLGWLLSDGREFVAGSKWTVADAFIYPLVEEWIENGEILASPLVEWYERITKRDSVARAVWADANEF